MADAKLIIKILTDASDAVKGVDQAQGKLGKFNDTMSGLVGPATAALGGIAAIGLGTINAASDMQQAMGGVDAVFGDSAGQIKAWGEEASTAAGLSESAYGSLATTMGAQLKNMGVPLDQVADKTGGMIQLGADLAAQFGGSSADAVAALSSALRGEADPAEKYGLALSQTAVNAELAAQGLEGLEGEQLVAAKAAAVMKLATEQAGAANGAYAREADTLAGAQATANAEWENAAAALGTALLPAITPVVQALGDFAQWIGENTTLVGVIIGIIGALSAAVLIYAAAQWIANSAMLANPVFWIVAGIVLLVAALVAAAIWVANNTEAIAAFFAKMWQSIQDVVAVVVNWFKSVWGAVSNWFKSVWSAVASFFSGIWTSIIAVVNSVVAGIRSVIGTVANWFKSVWNDAINAVASIIRTLQGVFNSVMNAIMAPIRAVANAFDAVVGAIKNVINWISKIKIPDLGALGGLVGLSASAAAPASAALGAAGLSVYRGGPVAVPSLGSVGGAGGGTVINVHGGLDSADTIARRISQLLTARDRRAHGVTITRSAR